MQEIVCDEIAFFVGQEVKGGSFSEPIARCDNDSDFSLYGCWDFSQVRAFSAAQIVAGVVFFSSRGIIDGVLCCKFVLYRYRQRYLA